MSSQPSSSPSQAARPPVTIPQLQALKLAGTPIVTVTAYDMPSARAAEAAGADMVLVGDSGGMVVLGHPTTVPVTLEEMLMLTAAARRGITSAFLIGDLPFGSYEVSDEQAVATAVRFVKEGGADAVKLERGTRTSAARAAAIVEAGIPVMGHVGLTPQTATSLGGYRAQGRSVDSALTVARGALALQDAGCFSIVFEAVPAEVTKALMPRMHVPIIGIGAGPDTDGQVLVFHDLLGIREGKGAKFVKRYADLQDAMNQGVTAFAEDVRSGAYPAPEHTYAVKAEELATFTERLAEL
jgi:3-methyl-2-oxobutanoate hydroxymethyltransferase